MAELERAIEAAYLAVRDPRRWPDALAAMAALASATAWDLRWSDAAGPESAAFDRAYPYAWGRLSGRALSLSPAPRAFIHSRIDPACATLGEPGLQMLFDLDDRGAQAVLRLARSRRQPDFDEPDLALALAAHPHLARCLAHSASRPGIAQPTSAAVLDGFATPCLVLDDRGRVVFANAAARPICAEADGLALTDGRLTTSGGDRRELWPRFRDLLLEGDARPDAATPELVVDRPSGRAPLVVAAWPLRNPLSRGGVGVALYVYDTEPRDLPPDEALRIGRLFGFTPAEADVVRLWMGGHTAPEIARRRGSSVPTVRAQLRVAMEKAGTVRSGDLFRLQGLAGARSGD